MHHRAVCLCCRSARGLVCRSLTVPTLRPKLFGTSEPYLDFARRSSSRALSTQHGDGNKTPASSSDDASASTAGDWHTEVADVDSIAAKDIFIDDLSATLQAHRESNRAAIIRRIPQESAGGPGFLNLLAISEPQDVFKDEAIVGDNVDFTHATLPSVPEEVATNPEQDATPATFSIRKGQTRQEWTSTFWPADSTQLAELTGKMYKGKEDEVLEYTACQLPVQGPYSLRKNQEIQRPWLTILAKENIPIGKSHLRLRDELKAYETFMGLTSPDEEAARLLISDVTDIVNRKYPGNRLEVIGSYSTGLANRLSDLDFKLSFPQYEKDPLQRGPSPTRIKARKDGSRALLRIEHALRSSRGGQFENVELINARVPIVKALHRGTQTKIELQTLASQASTREYVAAYLAEFPTLRTLYQVLRSALYIRYLTNVWKGGLGSYSIFMMIVNALKHASGRFASDDLANHFLHVLDFYGNADLYKYGFSPDPPRTILKRGSKMSADEKIARLQDPMLRGIDILEPYKRQKPYLLFLQDPANPVNDLGAKAYGIKHVQHLFGHFGQRLSNRMRLLDEKNPKIIRLVRTQGLLAELLEANYEPLAYQSQRLHRWAKARKRITEKQGSLVSMPQDEPRNPVPTIVAGTSEEESHIVHSQLPPVESETFEEESKSLPENSETLPEESVVLSAENSKEAFEPSMYQDSPQADEPISALAADQQQTLSQNLFNQKYKADSVLKPHDKSEAIKPNLTAVRGWKRWTPSETEDTPQNKDADSKSGSPHSFQKSDVAHARRLLERLRRLLPEKDYEKLKSKDWQALARLTQRKDLKILGIDGQSEQDKIRIVIRSYISRVPIEDLFAIENEKAIASTNSPLSHTRPQSTQAFLQSIGLAAHFKKLKSLDLYQLAEMSRLDYGKTRISMLDAGKIHQGLQKFGIRAPVGKSSTNKPSLPSGSTSAVAKVRKHTGSPSLVQESTSSSTSGQIIDGEHARRSDETSRPTGNTIPMEEKAPASLSDTASKQSQMDTHNGEAWLGLVTGDMRRSREYIAEQNSCGDGKARWIWKSLSRDERFKFIQLGREKHGLPMPDMDYVEKNHPGEWYSQPTAKKVSPAETASPPTSTPHTASQRIRKSVWGRVIGTVMKQRQCSQNQAQTIWKFSNKTDRTAFLRVGMEEDGLTTEDIAFLAKNTISNTIADLLDPMHTAGNNRNKNNNTNEAPILNKTVTTETALPPASPFHPESVQSQNRGIGRLPEAIGKQKQCSNHRAKKIWRSSSEDNRPELLQMAKEQFGLSDAYLSFISNNPERFTGHRAAAQETHDDAAKPPVPLQGLIDSEQDHREPLITMTPPIRLSHRPLAIATNGRQGWETFTPDPELTAPTPSPDPSVRRVSSDPPVVREMGGPDDYHVLPADDESSRTEYRSFRDEGHKIRKVEVVTHRDLKT